jgi:hypothetical protein
LSALFFFVSFDLLFANNGIGRSKQSNQRDYISACVVYMMMMVFFYIIYESKLYAAPESPIIEIKKKKQGKNQ